MSPSFDENDDAFLDLPEGIKNALRNYGATRESTELDAVIFAVLKDLGADMQPESITNETNFVDDLGLDSLAIAEFVFFFEDIFKIKITNESLAKMRTLGALKRFLKNELA